MLVYQRVAVPSREVWLAYDSGNIFCAMGFLKRFGPMIMTIQVMLFFYLQKTIVIWNGNTLKQA